LKLGKKIVILGSSGCGKTTFAVKLSNKINIKHYEIDSIFWKPGWIQTGQEEFRDLIDKVTAKDEWIIDGNYRRVKDLTIGRADTIIWLDLKMAKIMYRVTLRTAGRLIKRKTLWHNNRETLKMAFSRDSIILYSLNHYHSKRAWNNKLIRHSEMKHLNWIIIRNSREEREFWKNF